MCTMHSWREKKKFNSKTLWPEKYYSHLFHNSKSNLFCRSICICIAADNQEESTEENWKKKEIYFTSHRWRIQFQFDLNSMNEKKMNRFLFDSSQFLGILSIFMVENEHRKNCGKLSVKGMKIDW